MNLQQLIQLLTGQGNQGLVPSSSADPLATGGNRPQSTPPSLPSALNAGGGGMGGSAGK